MNHKAVLEHCVCVLDTYNVHVQSIDEHVNRYLKENLVCDEDEQTFIVEVFSGCIRYAEIMAVVLRGFFAKDGKNVLKSEENLYKVLCYLALFRLDELGMANYRQFVRGQDINRMYKFLKFFINQHSLTTWMKDEWQKYYEHVFVQTQLISPILRWLPELKEMVVQMKEKIENINKPRRKALTATEMKPFNITQPRPKSVPVPQPKGEFKDSSLSVRQSRSRKEIPKLEKHKPPPDTLYKQPSEVVKIDRVKQENRRKAEERLIDASRRQFACANAEKSAKTKEKIQHILTTEENKLDFDRHKTNKAPSFLMTPHSSRVGSARKQSQEVPVKMTAAAILREGHLYQKREHEELKKLEDLEAGAKDKSEFERWQSGMRQQDLEEQLAEVERRRLAGKLSHEEAILARQGIIRDNRTKVAAIKEETEKMMKRFLEEKFKEEQQMKQLVEDTMQGHKNAKHAQKKLQEYKQKLVQEVAAESQELMARAIEEAEVEMRRRMELIHQIRAMEAVPVIRQKFVDLTATSGHGLLSEMSIAELRERLNLLANAEKEEEEMRRDDILLAKEAKNHLLLETMEKISKHRLEQTRTNANRLEGRKKGEGRRPPVVTDELTALQRRLEEKKQQRLAEQEAARLVPTSSSSRRTKSLINQKKHLEENRWKELESTRERSAKVLETSYAKSAGRLNPLMSAS